MHLQGTHRTARADTRTLKNTHAGALAFAFKKKSGRVGAWARAPMRVGDVGAWVWARARVRSLTSAFVHERGSGAEWACGCVSKTQPVVHAGLPSRLGTLGVTTAAMLHASKQA
eukprot:3775752-Pleurochrysis_carterae.AAC.1